VRERQVLGCEFEGERYDIGDKVGFVRATVAFALKRPDLRDKVLEYLRSAIH
jgi:UTP--glucose-1-phosphate uridylyltransferase